MKRTITRKIVVLFVRIIGMAQVQIPYTSHMPIPLKKRIIMPKDISLADLVFKIRVIWGTKEAVVRNPAVNPIRSLEIINSPKKCERVRLQETLALREKIRC